MSEANTILLSTEDVQRFAEQGYLGPYTLFDSDTMASSFHRCYPSFPNLLLPSALVQHNVAKGIADLATHPRIVNKIISLLGNNVLLWGSEVRRDKSYQKRPFHRIAEYSAIDGVTVWLAVKNVSGNVLKIIPGSHLWKPSPQELSRTVGFSRSDDTAVLAAAKKLAPLSKILHLDLQDGQFVLLHGKLWQSTKNTTVKTTCNINLYYTKPFYHVRIAKNDDLPHPEWEEEEPACLLVSGEDRYCANALIEEDDINTTKSWLRGLFLYLPRNVVRRVLHRQKEDSVMI